MKVTVVAEGWEADHEFQKFQILEALDLPDG